MAVVVIIVVVLAAFVLGKLLVASLNDFVELASVEPYAATLGAVINFYSLAIRNGQQDIAFWTIHGVWWYLICVSIASAPKPERFETGNKGINR